MKEFDMIDNIGKKMPHKAPSEEFFASFKSDMMQQIAKEESKKQGLKISLRRIIPALAIAASLTVGIFVMYKTSDQPISTDKLVSDNLEDSIDSYFDNLSDDELAYLLDNTSSQDDFYSALPKNE